VSQAVASRNAKLETRNLLAAGLLLSVCFLTYANSLSGAFTYDDKAVVRDNLLLRAPSRTGELFRTSYFGWPRGIGVNYRPILMLSYAAQWWVHGGWTAGYHAVNIAVHALVTILLWLLLRRLCVAPAVAWTAALLFAVDPVHVEAVASVVGRGETLAALFVLGMLHLSLSAARGRRPALSLAGALACYALGSLTKESAVVAPALAFLVLLAAGTGPARARARFALVRGAWLYAGSALVLLGVLLLRRAVLGTALTGGSAGIYQLENPLAPLPGWARAWNAAAILVRYTGRIVFPLELTADESAWSLPILTGRSLPALAGVCLLALAAAASVTRFSKKTPSAFGFLFFVAAFLPAANLLFPIGTLFAERLAYLPSAGVCLVLAAALAGAGDLSEWTRRRRAAVATVALLFSARAIVRNTVWRSDEALFANSIRTSPGSAKAWYNDALIAVERGEPRRGLDHARRAIEIYPNYWDAFAVLGHAERELNLLAESEASYAKSVELNASYDNGWYGLGMTREARGDLAGAEEAFASGLTEVETSFPLAYHLARIRTKLARPTVEDDWQRALGLSPDSVAARLGYAGWLTARGRETDARKQWREALRRDPASLEGLRGLAASNARLGFALGERLARAKIARLTGRPVN
jgi:tetratricopeptide (TPR) repeat protein